MAIRFEELHQATEALYLREYRKIQDVHQEEARLRAALRKLDQQARDARTPMCSENAMQMVGADVLWQGWASRTRRQVNIELAQALARKSIAMTGLREAFGRQRAIEAIVSRQKAENARVKNHRFLDALIRKP